MKKYVTGIILVCAAVIGLSGCGSTKNDTPQDGTDRETTIETEQASREITLYVGNGNADGFVTETVVLEAVIPENIIAALAEKNVVSDEVKVLAFEDAGETLTLDLSKEYQEYVSSYGTAGELIAVGGVVNTFLDAYDADTITILVEGKSWDTGHAEYSGPLGKYPM